MAAGTTKSERRRTAAARGTMALSKTKEGRLKLHLVPSAIRASSSRLRAVHIQSARGGLGACSAHAQWATVMRADTLHVVSVLTVLSNVTFKDGRFYPSPHSLRQAQHSRHLHTNVLTCTCTLRAHHDRILQQRERERVIAV